MILDTSLPLHMKGSMPSSSSKLMCTTFFEIPLEFICYKTYSFLVPYNTKETDIHGQRFVVYTKTHPLGRQNNILPNITHTYIHHAKKNSYLVNTINLLGLWYHDGIGQCSYSIVFLVIPSRYLERGFQLFYMQIG